jgi:hypothetical protein
MLKKIDYLFIAVAGLVVLFFLAAPPESTLRIPNDEEHKEFSDMLKKEGKKAVEKFCKECHSDEMMPLSKDHPPKYRCLFCHKLTSPSEGMQPEKP